MKEGEGWGGVPPRNIGWNLRGYQGKEHAKYIYRNGDTDIIRKDLQKMKTKQVPLEEGRQKSSEFSKEVLIINFIIGIQEKEFTFSFAC